MRGLVLILALVTVAGSAAGAPRPHTIFSAPTPALRGAQQPPPATVEPVLPLLPAPSLVSIRASADDCRRACARSYYFCVANSGPDECGPTWGQCRSDCEAPNFSGLSAR